MATVIHLWNQWQIQILVLLSFALQVFLLLFAGMRRGNMCRARSALLWLVYLLADSIALYILGHMSISSKSRDEQQLMAFWAPFLLVHLGGQDTITAYSMEDNRLWLRHLLSLVVQSLGVAYVLYKYTTGSWRLVTAATLMFVVGILKYGERIWALKSSCLDSISKFLDSVETPRRAIRVQGGQGLGSEDILREAHDLFHICMGQFADYKFWPSQFQSESIKVFCGNDYTKPYELAEMQLSLMYDILYTKAAVVHTWYGCVIRVVSGVATVTAFCLFQSSIGNDDYNRFSVGVTNTLLVGAFLLEMASLLRAMGSTWTSALLRAGRWDRLHSKHVILTCCIKAVSRSRRWSGSIGQHNLVDLLSDTKSRGRIVVYWIWCKNLWKKLFHTSFIKISAGTKELVMKEILRVVEACDGRENIMRSYRGQCVLKGFCEDLISSTEIDFDDSILTWHFATEFILFSARTECLTDEMAKTIEAIKALSNYMMFLFVERPHMLPNPVRPRVYANAKHDSGSRRMESVFDSITRGDYDNVSPADAATSLKRGATLAANMLRKGLLVPKVLEVVLGLWVEMLSYAAYHCSSDSHARQLNNGGEFLTIVWLLTTLLFNRSYCDQDWFKTEVDEFMLRSHH